MMRLSINMGAGCNLELNWRPQVACFLRIPARPRHHAKWSTLELPSATCNYIDVQSLPVEVQPLRPPKSASRPRTPFQRSHCVIWGVDDPQHLSGLWRRTVKSSRFF